MKFNRVLNLDSVIRNFIICNSADHYNFEKEKIRKFDVICRLDLIEHLFDPSENLKKIYKYLSNGKYLILETLALDVEYPPKGIQIYFRINHPFYLIMNSLKNLIEKSGFEIKKILNQKKTYYFVLTV